MCRGHAQGAVARCTAVPVEKLQSGGRAQSRPFRPTSQSLTIYRRPSPECAHRCDLQTKYQQNSWKQGKVDFLGEVSVMPRWGRRTRRLQRRLKCLQRLAGVEPPPTTSLQSGLPTASSCAPSVCGGRVTWGHRTAAKQQKRTQERAEPHHTPHVGCIGHNGDVELCGPAPCRQSCPDGQDNGRDCRPRVTSMRPGHHPASAMCRGW